MDIYNDAFRLWAINQDLFIPSSLMEKMLDNKRSWAKCMHVRETQEVPSSNLTEGSEENACNARNPGTPEHKSRQSINRARAMMGQSGNARAVTGPEQQRIQSKHARTNLEKDRALSRQNAGGGVIRWIYIMMRSAYGPSIKIFSPPLV